MSRLKNSLVLDSEARLLEMANTTRALQAGLAAGFLGLLVCIVLISQSELRRPVSLASVKVPLPPSPPPHSPPPPTFLSLAVRIFNRASHMCLCQHPSLPRTW